ncbi:hypothetical protein M408DRAFT_332279 [Serendipita vermifera MAFF 305830]|uniref:MICOS complex subunit n=1 Tax=Serendipita vermifera MAFF 305830 TaxID=933852 RepID=A0A0C3AFX2_SERVB|nr:hypothetical protein M408DRAFT_332279 [Serendipita vermifera MAFF 305830]
MFRLARPTRLLVLGAAPVLANRELPKETLPIYPTESPKPEIVEAPTQLEAAIRQAREKATDTYGIGRAHLQFVVDRWIGVEHSVESRLKSLAPPPDVEPLFPGALWVGIAALSGSILAPKRSPIRRIIYPPAWGFLAALYFLPLTTDNVGKYIVELEDRYIPNVAKKQKEIAARLRASLADGKDKTKELREGLSGQVDKLGVMIRERTGLKVGEKSEENAKK